jgi:hypothetical protein
MSKTQPWARASSAEDPQGKTVDTVDAAVELVVTVEVNDGVWGGIQSRLKEIIPRRNEAVRARKEERPLGGRVPEMDSVDGFVASISIFMAKSIPARMQRG